MKISHFLYERILKRLTKMFENILKSQEAPETIQEIAIKLAEEQFRMLHQQNGPKERTVFILGSKGVGKSTVINTFFDRDETPRPTLALEYSYGRRTGSSAHAQKHVLNIWELGSLENAAQLVEVPFRTHGINNFAAIIMLDLSQPQRIWLDLDQAYRGLKEASNKILGAMSAEEQQRFQERAVERLKKEHTDIGSLELMPFPIVLVGGKYDLFKDYDPEVKKHICRCLRSMAHLIGGSVLFYANKIPKLSKTLRDTISHLGFGSPTNPFRAHITDHNDALSIWFGTDSWERISGGTFGVMSLDNIAAILAVEIPQLQSGSSNSDDATTEQTSIADPAKDVGFQESIIDEMRAQKDEELQMIIKEVQLRGQFESVANT